MNIWLDQCNRGGAIMIFPSKEDNVLLGFVAEP